MPLKTRLIDRKTCKKETKKVGRLSIHPEVQKYLDFGMISKYRKSGEICIDHHERNESDYAILVESGPHVVGLFKFDLRGRRLISRGTWVSRSARRQGLATKLWGKAIRKFGVTSVEVTAVSDRGKTLVDRLTKKFRKVKWNVSYEGDRELRNLAARG